MKFALNENDSKGLTTYLKSYGVIPAESNIVKLTKAGEGNMNLTLRAELNDISLIVKQANPFVQKYPSIPAPVERAEMEYAFFQRANSIEGLSVFLPKPIFHDPENHLQVIEDLGHGGDFSIYYDSNEGFPRETMKELIGFLKLLHESTKNGEVMANEKMRELNHTHIFDLPFKRDNGIDLAEIQTGLAALADNLIFSNEKLRSLAKKLGEIYLSAEGPSLLHGDFFPGSWLNTSDGIKIIDPEFCFSGPVEFELGVFVAHSIFCGLQPEEVEEALKGYGRYDRELSNQFAGIEILRRLFGVAQLPMNRSIDEKENLSRMALKLLNL
jgi:5-methylthioribose kinase